MGNGAALSSRGRGWSRGVVVFSARLLEQIHECAKIFSLHVAQLCGMNVIDGFVELVDELMAFFGDDCVHYAPVSCRSAANDQAPCFKPVEKSRDVGIAVHQPVSNFAAW